MDWSGVDYCDVFISCLDSARILQIGWRNKLIYILDELRVSTFTASFHFWVNYSFKAVQQIIYNLNNFNKCAQCKRKCNGYKNRLHFLIYSFSLLSCDQNLFLTGFLRFSQLNHITPVFRKHQITKQVLREKTTKDTHDDWTARKIIIICHMHLYTWSEI